MSQYFRFGILRLFFIVYKKAMDYFPREFGQLSGMIIRLVQFFNEYCTSALDHRALSFSCFLFLSKYHLAGAASNRRRDSPRLIASDDQD